jgi:Holliday junction resolvase RusA-like endonuclease
VSAILHLTLPEPPSSNVYWRIVPGRGLTPSDEALEYKARVAKLCVQLRPLVGPVIWSGVWYRGRKTGDLSNRQKVLEDSLIGFAYLDDGQIEEYRRWRRSDEQPSNPRVVLELEGAAFATVEQARAAAEKKQQAAAKRRATVRRNQAEKAIAERILAGGLRRQR